MVFQDDQFQHTVYCVQSCTIRCTYPAWSYFGACSRNPKLSNVETFGMNLGRRLKASFLMQYFVPSKVCSFQWREKHHFYQSNNLLNESILFHWAYYSVYIVVITVIISVHLHTYSLLFLFYEANFRTSSCCMIHLYIAWKAMYNCLANP